MNKKNISLNSEQTSKNKSLEKAAKTNSQNNRPNMDKREKMAYDKTITFKLDRGRFIQLKTYGLHADKSNQVILIEALDAYLAKHSEEKNHA